MQLIFANEVAKSLFVYDMRLGCHIRIKPLTDIILLRFYPNILYPNTSIIKFLDLHQFVNLSLHDIWTHFYPALNSNGIDVGIP